MFENIVCFCLLLKVITSLFTSDDETNGLYSYQQFEKSCEVAITTVIYSQHTAELEPYLQQVRSALTHSSLSLLKRL